MSSFKTFCSKMVLKLFGPFWTKTNRFLAACHPSAGVTREQRLNDLRGAWAWSLADVWKNERPLLIESFVAVKYIIYYYNILFSQRVIKIRFYTCVWYVKHFIVHIMQFIHYTCIGAKYGRIANKCWGTFRGWN